MTNPDLLTLVDVGSSGSGVQAKWRPHLSKLRPVLFEPNPPEAEALRKQLGEAAIVLETGLSNRTEMMDLQITKNKYCTSILTPNFDLLNRYSIAPNFTVVQTVPIKCVRYDDLFYTGSAPAPDVIKIDVQGFEHQALLGFGSLLSQCLGIELETHFYPLYRDQKLFHELIALLDQFGMVLRKMTTVPHFDGDIIEVDAYFTKRSLEVSALSLDRKWKFELMSRVWEIPAILFAISRRTCCFH
jgi:FkbM family methyltransferase